jgi:hypothetical protein
MHSLKTARSSGLSWTVMAISGSSRMRRSRRSAESSLAKVSWSHGSSIAPARGYTGRMLVDGEIYTPGEATKKFLATAKK